MSEKPLRFRIVHILLVTAIAAIALWWIAPDGNWRITKVRHDKSVIATATCVDGYRIMTVRYHYYKSGLSAGDTFRLARERETEPTLKLDGGIEVVKLD